VEARREGTHQSPVDSVRFELAVLPAAADAKVGAILN